jgi:hypothetical protein
MLNDLISLVVALWAIRLADQRHPTHSKYSYGWQRAEILGALFNGKEKKGTERGDTILCCLLAILGFVTVNYR